jgi:DHA1 family tetracycline resistance protein-like MFS transporter
VGGITMPSLQAMLARQIDDSRQGELQGTLTSIASLIGVGGPLAATWLYAASQHAWPGLVWAIGAALYLLVLPLLFNSRMRSQQGNAVGTSASD